MSKQSNARQRRRSRRPPRGGAAEGARVMRLAELRKRLGLTQAQVAKAMGVSQSSISQLESQNDMQVSTLSHIAQALGGRLRLVIDLPDGSFTLPHFAATARGLRAAGSERRPSAGTLHAQKPMSDLKQFVVKYEMLGEDLQKIVNLYNQQRSEEAIEDMEKQIDQSYDATSIYDAINDSYLDRDGRRKGRK